MYDVHSFQCTMVRQSTMVKGTVPKSRYFGIYKNLSCWQKIRGVKQISKKYTCNKTCLKWERICIRRCFWFVFVLGTVSKDFIILSVSKTVQCQNEGPNWSIWFEDVLFFIFIWFCHVLGIYLGTKIPATREN